MSGGEVQALTALFEVIGKIGALPLGAVFLTIIGPWIALGIGLWMIERGQNKRYTEFQQRHTEAVQMYKDNVELVNTTSKIAESLKQLTSDNQGILLKHTEVLTELVTSIKTNQYCPSIRTEKKTVEVSAT